MASLLFPDRNRNDNVVTKFNEFAKGMTPDGARRKIEELLRSGWMSQQQFEEMRGKAELFVRMLK